MVNEQIRARGVHDERVLQALRALPRHLFVPEDQRSFAYLDSPLPIGGHQTISQPYIVALMTELLGLGGNETVLEVGTGSGYQAALLARLARQVYSIERRRELAERARTTLEQLGIVNVEVLLGDGSCGAPEHAPYQAIMVTAAAPRVPPPLLAQLAPGGVLVVPVGETGGQILQVWRRARNEWRHEDVAPVAFVPLVGKHGWSSNQWT